MLGFKKTHRTNGTVLRSWLGERDEARGEVPLTTSLASPLSPPGAEAPPLPMKPQLFRAPDCSRGGPPPCACAWEPPGVYVRRVGRGDLVILGRLFLALFALPRGRVVGCETRP